MEDNCFGGKAEGNAIMRGKKRKHRLMQVIKREEGRRIMQGGSAGDWRKWGRRLEAL